MEKQTEKAAFIKSTNYILLHLLVVLLLFCLLAHSQVVKTLPGYSGDLPFQFETGYIGIGEEEDVQLFYYFVESQRSPRKDPLMLWFAGGPGCSSLRALFYSSGPLSFDTANYSGGLPTLYDNPFAWTKVVSIIYLDSPVGTGYSYSRSLEGYYTGDKKAAAQVYEFLRKWLLKHPTFKYNQVFIGGDSYAGKVLPAVVQDIYNGNLVGEQPLINLQGYILGNPVTDPNIDGNAEVRFYHRVTLIPNELFQAALTSCNGDFVNIDPNNTECERTVAAINQLVARINTQNILEPICNTIAGEEHRDLLDEYRVSNDTSSKRVHSFWCRNDDFMLVDYWANTKVVQEAMHVRQGTIKEWVGCNESLAGYTEDIVSTVPYHRNLTETSLRSLVYSGDYDAVIPHIGTREWIQSLNMTMEDIWQPWLVDGQVAGYFERYSNGDFRMTFATVKGAGHVAPDYKHKECFKMVDRWFAQYPL